MGTKARQARHSNGLGEQRANALRCTGCRRQLLLATVTGQAAVVASAVAPLVTLALRCRHCRRTRRFDFDGLTFEPAIEDGVDTPSTTRAIHGDHPSRRPAARGLTDGT